MPTRKSTRAAAKQATSNIKGVQAGLDSYDDDGVPLDPARVAKKRKTGTDDAGDDDDDFPLSSLCLPCNTESSALDAALDAVAALEEEVVELRRKLDIAVAGDLTDAALKAGDLTAWDLVAALKALPRSEGKKIASDHLDLIAPKFRPMADVLDSEVVKRAIKFITAARVNSKEEKKSYQQLEKFVQSIGLEPKQVIHFTEKKWKIPTPNRKKKPGTNRNRLAGHLFLNIIKHKQRACCTCGKSFEDITAPTS